MLPPKGRKSSTVTKKKETRHLLTHFTFYMRTNQAVYIVKGGNVLLYISISRL